MHDLYASMTVLPINNSFSHAQLHQNSINMVKHYSLKVTTFLKYCNLYSDTHLRPVSMCSELSRIMDILGVNAAVAQVTRFTVYLTGHWQCCCCTGHEADCVSQRLLAMLRLVWPCLVVSLPHEFSHVCS